MNEKELKDKISWLESKIDTAEDSAIEAKIAVSDFGAKLNLLIKLLDTRNPNGWVCKFEERGRDSIRPKTYEVRIKDGSLETALATIERLNCFEITPLRDGKDD